MKKSKISLKKRKLRDRQKFKLKERVERTIKRKDTDFLWGDRKQEERDEGCKRENNRETKSDEGNRKIIRWKEIQEDKKRHGVRNKTCDLLLTEHQSRNMPLSLYQVMSLIFGRVSQT